MIAERSNEPFIDSNQANALLNYPIGSGRQVGLTCECCVYRCTTQEFDQYCEPLERARRTPSRLRRSAGRRGVKSRFSDEDIKKIYDSINRSMSNSEATQDTKKVSLKLFDQISTIKAWKLKNIERKLLVKFGLDAEGGSVTEVNKASPPSKVTNDESNAHASKPKLFSDVNKESQPVPHHHRHKYSTLTDVANTNYL